MPIKNEIVNYFVVPSFSKEGKHRIFKAPVTTDYENAKRMLQNQLKDKSLNINNLLHVCFDVNSRRVYVINPDIFTNKELKNLLQFAEYNITKEYGYFANTEEIYGSPFSLIRVRTLDTFPYVFDHVKKVFKDNVDNIIKDVIVIEANLLRMPLTVKTLPIEYKDANNSFGGFISPKDIQTIKFIESFDVSGKEKKNPVLLMEQKTPFILINIAAKNLDYTEKEQTVLYGLQDYIIYNSSKYNIDNERMIKQYSLISQIKHKIYLGWPFEEICNVFVNMFAKDFIKLMNISKVLMYACDMLVQEGHKNPASINYYMSFKVKKNKFPYSLDTIMKDGKIEQDKQIDLFRIIDYDESTEKIVIESPIYISENICKSILMAESEPIITKYNQNLNIIEVKNGNTLKDKDDIDKLKSLTIFDIKKAFPEIDIKKTEIKTSIDAKTFSPEGSKYIAGAIFDIRKLSDYYYAAEKIKNICKKNNVEFKDIDILIGPLEILFGKDIRGGFMGENEFRISKLKIPYKLSSNIYLSPPIIAIDNVTNPSYSKQLDIIIHEYSHNIFSIINPGHEAEYSKQMKLKKEDPKKWWFLYFNDPNERFAHIQQIKVLLESGLSVDEIIRDKVGGAVDTSNYAIALKFKELVQEAIEELEKESKNDEQPGREN